MLLILPIVYLILKTLSKFGRLRKILLYWSLLPVGLYYITGLVYENWDNVGATKGIYAKHDKNGAVTDKYFWFRLANEPGKTGQLATFFGFIILYFISAVALSAGYYLLEGLMYKTCSKNKNKGSNQIPYTPLTQVKEKEGLV